LRIFDGSSSIGHVIAFFALLRLLVGSVELLMGLWPAFQHGLASFSRLAEILDLPVESSAPRRRPAPLRTRGALAAIDLRFGYQPENLVLDGVDFEIRPGESVALVGRSGVGKSTLVKLILGWQTPRSGQLLLDGRDVRSLDLDWRRRQLGWVPQDIFLWSRSIAENLTFGRRGVALADLERVAAAAQILEFIQSLPQGFATVLGEAASELSGGQRQGLAIARELLRDPPILLLDEATSQLDALSEHRLQTATANLLRGRTSLVVAHRFSTIRDCDRVLVLDRGRIVEQGRYDQLQGVGLFEELRRLQAA
jgi:ABC-type multidrug transport system fused ATPase/permease subunit